MDITDVFYAPCRDARRAWLEANHRMFKMIRLGKMTAQNKMYGTMMEMRE